MRLRLNLFLLCFTLTLSPAGHASEWIAGWQQTEPMTTRRAGAAVVHVGKRIYVLGGVDGIHFLRSTEFTTIQPDGTLTPWQGTSPMTEERGFFSAVQYRGYLYAVGGGNGENGEHLLRSVERAKIFDDGLLGHWQKLDAKLQVPRRCVKLEISGNMLYAFGGFAGTLLDTVERAEIKPGGTIGPWVTENNKLTMPRYVHTVKEVNGNVYMIGGHRESEGVGLSQVEFSTLHNNRFDKPWQQTTPLTKGRYALAAATHGNWLYALGGLDGAIYQDVIEKVMVHADGTLGGWQNSTPLSSPRANLSTVVDGNHLYIIGGTNRDGYYNSVEYATFNDNGDIGFVGSAQQRADYEKLRNQVTKPTPLPNHGKVVEVIQTKSYSYLKVSGEGGARWLATSRADYAVGDLIGYSRGLTMTNFHSRTLNRSFDEILFVEKVEKIRTED